MSKQEAIRKIQNEWRAFAGDFARFHYTVTDIAATRRNPVHPGIADETLAMLANASMRVDSYPETRS